jgi:glycosyltransferase involved in cell wall biosynthesis
MEYKNYMKSALVTTCYNEIQSVHRWIDDVINQDQQPDEISIVDAGSTDGTRQVLEEWAKKDARLKLEQWPKCNVAQGRNRAITNTDAEIVVSTDMGCRLDSQWFKKICEPFKNDPDIKIVAGNYAADESTISTIAARTAYYINKGYYQNLGPGFLPSSRSIAYKKNVWEVLNGYPEDLTFAGDDTVYAFQIRNSSFKIAYAKEAYCYWGRHAKMSGYWREAFVYARGNGEAGILPPKFCNPDKITFPRILSHIDALQSTIRLVVLVFRVAILRKDYLCILLTFPLQYGITINSYKGYVVGVAKGLEACKSCRSRLK